MQCIECNEICNPILTTRVPTILLEITNLPLELCEKIESYYNYSIRCSICCNILCYKHLGTLKYHSKRYIGCNGAMCDDCCWNEYI